VIEPTTGIIAPLAMIPSPSSDLEETCRRHPLDLLGSQI